MSSNEGRTLKFMQSIDRDVYRKIARMAKERGITVQQFIRVIIIPEWMLSKRKR